MHEPIRFAVVTTILTLSGILSGCQKTQQYHFTICGHHMLNNGQPFFWLGDTAWLLVKQSPEDVQHYMTNRSSRAYYFFTSFEYILVNSVLSNLFRSG